MFFPRNEHFCQNLLLPVNPLLPVKWTPWELQNSSCSWNTLSRLYSGADECDLPSGSLTSFSVWVFDWNRRYLLRRGTTICSTCRATNGHIVTPRMRLALSSPSAESLWLWNSLSIFVGTKYNAVSSTEKYLNSILVASCFNWFKVLACRTNLKRSP